MTNATTNVGYINCYRYRSYRYDNETGLYYLQSRYYNADDTEELKKVNTDLLDYNAFAYCSNNSVNAEDRDGHWWGFLQGALKVVIGVAVVIDIPEEVVIGGLCLVAVGVFFAIRAVVKAAASAVSNAYNNYKFTKAKDSSKNEQHGDSGRALEKADQQIAELEKQLANAKSRKEKEKIKNKIQNIKKMLKRKIREKTIHNQKKGNLKQ